METRVPPAGARVHRDAQVPPPAEADEVARAEPSLIEEELLVEEVSIDGMCGVY
jgi:mycofactocin precursor